MVAWLATCVLAIPGTAVGQGPSGPLPSAAELDGLYLTVGPVGAWTRVGGTSTAAAGGEASLVWIQEHRLLAAFGVAAGGLGYTSRDGGRVWLEAEGAIKGPFSSAIGVGLGGTAEVDPVRPPRYGAQGTLWIFAGVVPYARIGGVQEAGMFLEVGVMIKIPAIRFSR